jgi:hypothetical protein
MLEFVSTFNDQNIHMMTLDSEEVQRPPIRTLPQENAGKE